MSNYKVWWPEDGETEEDAREIAGCFDAEDAATDAGKLDHDERDGWERSGSAKQMIAVREEGGGISQFYVCREYEPTFHIESKVDAGGGA